MDIKFAWGKDYYELIIYMYDADAEQVKLFQDKDLKADYTMGIRTKTSKSHGAVTSGTISFEENGASGVAVLGALILATSTLLI